MKRWMILLISLCLLLAIGASFKPVFVPGSYEVKPDGSWDSVEFPKDVYHTDKFSAFSQDQPANLKLEIPEGKFASYQFGRVLLGDAGTAYNFVIGNQKNFFYDTLYFDLDRNGVITVKEEVKLDEKQNIALGYVFQIFSADPKLKVDYRSSNGKTVTRELDIRMTFVYEKNSERANAFFLVRNSTLFTGTTLSENGSPLVFAIADGDANGCYNDFGTDLVFYDKNRDNKFNYVKESQTLAELQEMKGPDRKKDIYRLILFPWPTKLMIVPGIDKVNPADVEPRS